MLPGAWLMAGKNPANGTPCRWRRLRRGNWRKRPWDETVARMYGLEFLAVAPEHYDFLLVEMKRERPAVQAFLAALRDPDVRARIGALGMVPADE